jgi:hypothetical protein
MRFGLRLALLQSAALLPILPSDPALSFLLFSVSVFVTVAALWYKLRTRLLKIREVSSMYL